MLVAAINHVTAFHYTAKTDCKDQMKVELTKHYCPFIKTQLNRRGGRVV